MDSRDWRRWHIDFTHFAPPALQANLALRDRLRPLRAPSTPRSPLSPLPGCSAGRRDRRDRRPALARPGGRVIGAAGFSLTDDDLDESRTPRRARRRCRADETAEGRSAIRHVILSRRRDA